MSIRTEMHTSTSTSWCRNVSLLLCASLIVSCTPSSSTQRTVLTLPATVDIDPAFERGPDGLAVDMDAAQKRLESCLGQAGYPIDELSFDETMALMSEAKEYRAVMTICQEAAGTGWGPGNRADEVEVLDRQAHNTTQCVRDRGWEAGDPVLEEFGRFLRFNADASFSSAPVEQEEAKQYWHDVSDCFNLHIVDWRRWVMENPRN